MKMKKDNLTGMESTSYFKMVRNSNKVVISFRFLENQF